MKERNFLVRYEQDGKETLVLQTLEETTIYLHNLMKKNGCKVKTYKLEEVEISDVSTPDLKDVELKKIN